MIVDILLCDTFPGLLPDFIPDYPSMFMKLFDKVEENIRYNVYHIYKDDFPQQLVPGRLYLITGSNAGVYENKPWIKKLLAFIREAHTRKIKLAGICFGHQAVAQALGGKVVRSEKGWGTGIRVSAIIHPVGKKYFPDGKLALHYNHHDQVIVLPPAAEVIATSGFCPCEGMIIGSHILTFQGHPEYVDAYNIHLIRNHAAHEDKSVKEEALLRISTLSHQGETIARWILDFTRQP